MVVGQPDVPKPDGTLWLACHHTSLTLPNANRPMAAWRKASPHPLCSLCHLLARNRLLLNRWQSGEGGIFCWCEGTTPCQSFLGWASQTWTLSLSFRVLIQQAVSSGAAEGRYTHAGPQPPRSVRLRHCWLDKKTQSPSWLGLFRLKLMLGKETQLVDASFARSCIVGAMHFALTMCKSSSNTCVSQERVNMWLTLCCNM